MGQELSEFLSAEAEVGDYDSSGTFTLALSQALEKLGRSRLRNDEEALLKLIQAMVGWRAEAIYLTCDSNGFHLYAHTPMSYENFSSLVVDDAAGLYGDSSESDLLIGLGHFMARQPVQGTAGFSRWEQGRRSGWRGLQSGTPSTRIKIKGPPSGMTTALGIHFEFPQNKVQLQIWEIRKRCHFAPVPMHFAMEQEGRRTPIIPHWQAPDRDLIFFEYQKLAESLSGPSIGGRSIWTSTSEAGQKLKSRSLTGDGRVTVRQVGTRGGGHTFRDPYQGEIALCHGQVFVSSLSQSPREGTQLSRIYPVKRGVLLEALSVELPAPPSARATAVYREAIEALSSEPDEGSSCAGSGRGCSES